MKQVHILPYSSVYAENVKTLFADTALLGQPIDSAFPARNFFAAAFTRCYLDYNPMASFVAVDPGDGRFLGYLLGCTDSSVHRRQFLWRALPSLFGSFWSQGIIFQKGSTSFLARGLRSFLCREFEPKYPQKLLQQYPAHLHISICPMGRRFGVGRALVEHFLAYLQDNEVGGVHINTYADTAGLDSTAVLFFRRCGFEHWSAKPVRFFDAYGRSRMSLVTMVKALR